NCNGVVDKDGFATLTNACTAGVGTCQNSGTIVCKTTTTSGCSATADPTKASDEKCDGLDNNCDGQIDERIVSTTQQSCTVDANCTVTTAGNCKLIGAGPARSCGCVGNVDCPSGYACQNGRCTGP